MLWIVNKLTVKEQKFKTENDYYNYELIPQDVFEIQIEKTQSNKYCDKLKMYISIFSIYHIEITQEQEYELMYNIKH